MSAGLYASVGGVNRKIKKLYANVGGVNRPIEELWAAKDGVNRKIYSGAQCSAVNSLRAGFGITEDGALTTDSSYVPGTNGLTWFTLTFDQPISLNSAHQIFIRNLYISSTHNEIGIYSSDSGASQIANYSNLPTGTNSLFFDVKSGSYSTFRFVLYKDKAGDISGPAGCLWINSIQITSVDII